MSFALNLINLEQCLIFEHIVQSHNDMCLLVSNELCHIPLKYRCMIKKSVTTSNPHTLRALVSLPNGINFCVKVHNKADVPKST